MRLSDFDYDLPDALVAQRPCPDRLSARLMVLDRKSARIQHAFFRDIDRFLPPGALLVANNSRVIPARLLGVKRRTGGAVEVFLLKSAGGSCYECMLRPFKKIREGDELLFSGGLSGRLADRDRRIVEFDCADVPAALASSGHIPLPPYIRRGDDEQDRLDYQTVYGRRPGSVAAPTAGLHFTRPLIRQLRQRGFGWCEVTLHVGYGTFRPVESEDVISHRMHVEDYDVSPVTLAGITRARAQGRPVVAVGTTSCRVLETVARTGERCGSTGIFLYPGQQFQATDHLVTNFHLPRSTLLMLVCAFAGTGLVLSAYREAVREAYRFYSYGDAMLVL